MDHAGHVLLTATQLYVRAENTTSGNSTTTAGQDAPKPSSYKVIGLVLALCSGVFIGISFVMKKVGLLKANKKYNEEAGEGYGYLKNFWWWGGMTLMILGEICNFAAYLFADAILVTPLGALSVVITAILSAIFLKERLSFVGKLGCFSCIVGSTIIAVNAPEQASIHTIQDMRKLVIAPGFLVYLGVIIASSLFIALWLGPRYGKKSMMVYLSVCSLIGGLSVSCIQGIGAAITSQAKGIPQFNQWFLYVLLVFIIVTLVTEVIYLNKALNLYNAALVTPTYYVFFTSAVIVTSAVLFQGFKGTAIQILTVVLGFLQVCTGVVLLQLSKSAKDVPDTAVFNGDVDQIRTIAEQEEPEYEPRADSIRGGGAILRSLSKARQSRQMAEVEKLREEHLRPIDENETVEFDGIRRRRTVSGSSGSQGPIVRRKTIHPPLGMSQFPSEADDHTDDEYHPGFFHFRRKHRGSSRPSSTVTAGGASSVAGGAGGGAMPMSPLKGSAIASDNIARVESRDSDLPREHIYGLPAGLQRYDAHAADNLDTSYHSPGRIAFASDLDERPSSRGTSSASPAPPPAPPHLQPARRQFSFQNVFSRSRPGSATGAAAAADVPVASSAVRPLSRTGLSFNRKTSSSGRGISSDGTTEEERLGLVKGDSGNSVPRIHRRPGSSMSNSDDGDAHDEEEEEDRWEPARSSRSSAIISVHNAAAGGSTRDLTARPGGYSIDLMRETRARVPGEKREEGEEDEETANVIKVPAGPGVRPGVGEREKSGEGSGRFI